MPPVKLCAYNEAVIVQIGVDKAIEELITPLGQLKEEVMSLKLSLDTAIGSMETRLAYRAELRDKKVLMS